ncbi:uncharacterized protein LOC113492232 [Trichoplusia ni]|uniref:Sucrose-6-phosphate hydrolase n=1 Tax=Trichoplusia ni TaxID=7111 RepID=A0A7E5VAV2_TRINI|nr:uncharacterized protein LOC113492232 [Trichoplusia ni]
MQSIMGSLTVCVFLLSLCAGVLSCELKSSEKVISQRASLETYIKEKKPSIGNQYRLLYHVAPPVGWMNDPNGFSYFKGQFHLFYQFYPYNSSLSPAASIHWGHSTSANLIDWTEQPTALIPDEEQIFSGSAIEISGTLVLMYTAHINPAIAGQNATELQYLAFSNDGIVFNKYKNNPVISRSPNGSPDFRDPKVWKYGDYYYVVLGSRTDQGLGRVLLYRSQDMASWTFLSVVGQPSSRMGYMWECPDFFELGGKYILLMSPQGIIAEGDRYKNLYQTGYIIGDFNYQNHEFVERVPFQEIDYGHDFYATQTAERDGKRYLIAWFGMWNTTFPESAEGWAGAMTIFRELTLRGDRILMRPVSTINSLRESSAFNGDLIQNAAIQLNKTGELNVSGNLSQAIDLDIKGSEGGGVRIRWNATSKIVSVDRDGDVRQGPWTPVGSTSWRIFLDASSMELFCGEGEVVFSSRAYPTGHWVVTNLSAQSLSVSAFRLRKSV